MGIDVALCLLSLCFLLSVLFCFILYPMPETFVYEGLTDRMIAEGQGNFIILYNLLLPLLVPSIVISQFLTAIIGYQVLYERINPKYLDINLVPKSKIIGILIYFFFATLLPFFCFWPMLYFIYRNEPYKEPLQDELEKMDKDGNIIPSEPVSIKTRLINGLKRKRWLWIFVPILAILLLINAPLWFYLVIQAQVNAMNAHVQARPAEMKQALTLSQNKPNSMLLYFDRCKGNMMSEMIAVDHALFNKEDGLYKDDPNLSGTSFVELFPEATQYFNAFSLGGQTQISNPSINGSWYYSGGLKDSSLINPISKKPYKDETYNNWLLGGYQVSAENYKNNGYKNFSTFNNPYYGDQGYKTFIDSTSLQNDLNSVVKGMDITVFDRAETIKTWGKRITWSQVDDVRNIQYLGSHQNSIYNAPIVGNKKQLFPDDINTNPKYLNQAQGYGANEPIKVNGIIPECNLSVSPSRDSSFIMYHSNYTHEPYAYLKDDDSVSKLNPYGINYKNPSIGYGKTLWRDSRLSIIPTWYTLQKLKDIFTYLKNLPYTGPNSDVIKNQYDNTNIYIISDHGYMTPKNWALNNDILNFLVSKHYATQDDVDQYKSFTTKYDDYPVFNPTFIHKPRKYAHADWNKSTNLTHTKADLKNTINTSEFVTLADLSPIMEADMQKQIADANSSTTTFNFDASKSIFNPQFFNDVNKNVSVDEFKYNTYFKDKMVMNPLGNINRIDSRIIPLYYTTWKFDPNWTEFPAVFKLLFNPQSKTNKKGVLAKSFYNIDLYTKF